MKNMKVVLTSDFGSLADIWVKLTELDLMWLDGLVVEHFGGSLDIDGSDITVYLPNEENLLNLHRHFINSA